MCMWQHMIPPYLDKVPPCPDIDFCVIMQEGFGDYLETALRVTKLKKNREASDEESKVSLWNGAFAAGAVAVGAMAALTLRQAFS